MPETINPDTAADTCGWLPGCDRRIEHPRVLCDHHATLLELTVNAPAWLLCPDCTSHLVPQEGHELLRVCVKHSDSCPRWRRPELEFAFEMSGRAR